MISKLLAVILVLGVSAVASAATYTRVIRLSTCRPGSLDVAGASYPLENTVWGPNSDDSISVQSGGSSTYVICDLGLPANATSLDAVWLEYGDGGYVDTVDVALEVWTNDLFMDDYGFNYFESTKQGSCDGAAAGPVAKCQALLQSVSLAPYYTYDDPDRYTFYHYGFGAYAKVSLTGPGTANRIVVTYEAP